VADILKLSRAKVDEGVIVSYVQKAPHGNVSAADLLTLHSNGISSRVLVALLSPNSDSDQAQVTAPVEAPPPVTQEFTAQTPTQNVAVSTQPGVSYVSSPIVVETPVIQYVSAPVYVGGGSIYYHDYSWWGIGWGWGYPWYSYGWWPYYSYGYYAPHHHHGHHHGHHGHHGHDGHNGHHGYSGGNHQNGGGGKNPSSAGRSTIAQSGANSGRGMAASAASRSASGTATARPQVAANRAGANATSGNLSSRNAVNTI
jgi:hypothetical protein